MTGEEFCDWLKAANFTRWEAAKALGVSRADIEWYQERGGPKMLGLACQKLLDDLYGGSPDPQRIVQIVSRHEAGETFKAIAESLGIHQVRVAQIFHKAKERARQVRDTRLGRIAQNAPVRATPEGHPRAPFIANRGGLRLGKFKNGQGTDNEAWQYFLLAGRTYEGHALVQKISERGFALGPPQRLKATLWDWLAEDERPDLWAKFVKVAA